MRNKWGWTGLCLGMDDDPGRIREHIDYNLLTWLTEETMRGNSLLNLILKNKKEMVGDVKVKGSLGCSEMRWWGSGS